MTTERERLGYALAKQVPDMERGFTIHTAYGDIEIDAANAKKIARVVKTVIVNRLAEIVAEERQ